MAWLGLSLATVAWQAVAADPKASRFYEDALARYEKRDYNGAILQLKNAIQVDSTMLPVHVLLGKALLTAGDVGAAEVAFAEAIRLGVNRAEVVVPLARTLLLQGKPQEVLDQARFATAGLPAEAQMQLLILKSTAAADMGDSRLALKVVDDARALDPGAPDSWLAEVPLRIRARQFAEATAAADKAIALSRGSAEALYQRGSVAHAEGDKVGALAWYDKALLANVDHHETRVARVGLLMDLNRHAEALKDVAELEKRAPREPRGFYLRALLAERAGDALAAKAALRKVNDLIDPVPVDFMRFKSQLLLLNGLAHFGLGQREKAKPYLEMFHRAQPNSAVAKLLAQIYIAEQNIDKGIDALEGYLKAFPGDSQALALLASAHLSRGRHARAATLMQDALKSRDLPEFYTMLGLSLMRTGQTATAIEQLETAFRKDPTQTQAASALVSLYLNGRQTAKALTMAQALVKQDPRNPGYANLLGFAKAQANDLAGAKTAYETALKLDPSLTQTKLNLARLEMTTKAYAPAEARLLDILKTEERNVDALFEMAALADRQGQGDEALRWLSKAVDHSGPKELRPGLALVDLHLRAGRADKALEAARAVGLKDADNLAVLLSLARAQLAVGDHAAAKTTLGNATRLANFASEVQVEIAGLQVMARNLPGAAYSLEKALSDKPDYLPAQAMLAEVEARQGDHARAEQRARQIVQKHPGKAVGHALLGTIALSRGQIAPAIDSFRRAHQIEPTTDSALRLVRTMFSQDRKAAVQLAEQWIKSKPQDRAMRKLLAEGQVRAGNFTAARSLYDELLRLAPADVEVLNNQANVLLQLKDPSALKVAEQALAASPTSATVIDTAGWAAFQSGQADRALQLLRDARLRDPANPAIRYHLATVLAKAGRKGEAREELEVALRSKTVFDAQTEAEALLRTLK